MKEISLLNKVFLSVETILTHNSGFQVVYS